MLEVHRAERTSALATGLGALLRVPLADPFAEEVVAVPAQGVERWLAQRLAVELGTGGSTASADGVCAGIAFPPPARLVDEALAAAGGLDAHEDPWARPVWPLLDVLDGCLDEPWCAVLARHLGAGAAGPEEDHRRGRRYAAAAHLASLFRSYASHRPQLLRDWAQGQDTDDAGALPGDLRWQAELWRRLRGRLGPSPAERLPVSCAALRAEPARSALPERLSLFGPTRLAADQLAVLAALAEHRDVHLWLPHPSPALWAALRATLPAGPASVPRRADLPVAARHPLLRSLGRDVRELQVRLPPHRDSHVAEPAPGERPGQRSLLAALQADLRDDRPPVAVPGARADGSVQLHACHGPARQVEVLREVLLRLFEDDRTLEPRDVLVMCPDVEAFAPLVSAAFGLAAADRGEAAADRGEAAAGVRLHPGHTLRVRLADRSLRRTNPLLDTVARLLELAGGRVPASAVLDLAATSPVRRRFSFDDDDLERIRDWVARSGVRWGLDAAWRRPYGLDRVPQNTWRAGLDRLLLGVTTAEDEPVWLGLALPLDDVDSADIELVGRFAELVDRLELALQQLAGEQPAQDWLAALAEALDSLTATAEADAWQLAQARSELAEAARGATAVLRLADVRALLAELLRGRPTRAGFRTGSLTVCTMVPMRSVPHRVVVLLGLDDGVFPRVGAVDGDDVLARDPRAGERDVRSEDRQLLLDAMLAARERLLVLFNGADPVSGAPRPPAVPVGELLDVLEVMTPDAGRRVLVRHPLQPFDSGCFSGDPPFSFDPVGLAGARRARQQRHEPPLPAPLPTRGGPLALADLVAFLEHPVRAYLRQRLQVTLPGEDDEVDDALSVALDGLQEWAVGERLLAAALRGVDPAASRRAEWLRGTLPPGPLGSRVLERVGGRVGRLVAQAEPHLALPARAVDVRLAVGGRVLSGTVPGVRGGAVVTVSYASLSPRRRLRAYALALAVAAAGQGDRAVTVARRGDGAGTATALAPADPRAALEELLDLYDRGLREPLPLAAKTSAAYATSRLGGDTAEQALESAGRQWRAGRFPGEQDDRAHRHVWGDGAPLSVLTAEPVRAGDPAVPGEATRFGALAVRLWAPVHAAEPRS